MQTETAQRKYRESIYNGMYMWFNQTEGMYQLKYGGVFPAEGGIEKSDLIDSHSTLEGFAKTVTMRLRQAQKEAQIKDSAYIKNKPIYDGANVSVDKNKVVFRRSLDTQEFAELEKLVQKEFRE